MTPTQRNLAGNLASQGLLLAMGLTCLPAILQLVGVEAYGLVGLLWTLQSIATVMDFGWGVATSRELARLSDRPGATRALVSRLGRWYLLAGIVVAGVSWFAGPLCGQAWLRPRDLSHDQLQWTLRMIGLVVALQIPIAFFSSCAIGLQRLVPLSVIRSLAVIGSYPVAVAILATWSPSVNCFFSVQLFVSLAQFAAMFALVRLALPSAEFDARSTAIDWSGMGKFSAGVFGISVAGLLLSHADKLLLSKLLPLDEFGYYSLAAMIAAGLLSLAQPVFSVVLPRFSQLAGVGDDTSIEVLYHQSAQFLAVLLVPLGLTLAVLPDVALLAWTGSSENVSHSAETLRWLVVGSTLIGLTNVPYALQLAYGWTRLPLAINVTAVVTILPVMAILAIRHGGPGASMAWAALGAGYVLISVPIMHRRLLTRAWGAWLGHDVLTPLVPSLVIVLAIRACSLPSTRPQALLVLTIAMIAGYATAVLSTRITREWVFRIVSIARPVDRVPPPREIS